jgi:aspartyl-tRNA(Asn)/glutamyl-tRNA(Gln) amidotransferase subunit B
LGEYFEQVVSEFQEWLKSKDNKDIGEKEYKELAQIASNYILSDLLGLLEGISVEDERFLISPENFAEFVFLLYKKEMTSKISKIILKEMFEKGTDPSDIIQKMGLTKIENEEELGKIIEQVISQNLKAVKDFKDGKENAFQFLLGQAMAKTKGKASPEVLKRLFTKALK